MALSVGVARKETGPSPLMQALKRRLGELMGMLLVFLSFMLAVILASFDRRDPSPNHAAAGPVHNIVGPWGAYIADLLLQALGIAAASFPSRAAGPIPAVARLFRAAPGRAAAAPHAGAGTRCRRFHP